MFTAGEIPYPGIHPREVVQLLEDGEHLSRPKNKALSDNMLATRPTLVCHVHFTVLFSADLYFCVRVGRTVQKTDLTLKSWPLLWRKN